MLYYLKNTFIEINEPAGIIQNLSPFTLEVSTSNAQDSGIPIFPHRSYYFDYAPIYVRCIDGTAKTRIITAGVNSYEFSDMNTDCCATCSVVKSYCA